MIYFVQSLRKVYQQAVVLVAKNFFFYLVWSLFVFIMIKIIILSLAVYLHIIDVQALHGNFMSYFAYIFKDISGMSQESKMIVSSHHLSVHDFLKTIMPQEWLNPSLADMTWKEYFSVVIKPRCVLTAFGLTSLLVVVMTTSIGFVKVLLAAVHGHKSAWSDLYRHVGLLPAYALSLLLQIVVALSPLLFFVIAYFATRIPFVLFRSVVVFACLLLGILGLFAIWYLYERVRFIRFFVIDAQRSPVSALHATWQVTKGKVLFLLSITLINILIGYFLATTLHGWYIMPLFGIFFRQLDAVLYKKLLEQ